MMAYYGNLPSFKPNVDPQSFNDARMSPDDRATMNMRMDAAVPDAAPVQKAMPMGRFPANWKARPGIPTRGPAITPSFPVLNSRDTPPPLAVEPPPAVYGSAPPIMNPAEPAQPSAVSQYAGDIASKTFLPYVQSAITNAQQGNYLRSAGAAAGAVKQAAWDAPAAVLGSASGAIGSAADEFKAGFGGGSFPSFKDAFGKYGVTAATAAPAPSAKPAVPTAAPSVSGGDNQPTTKTASVPSQQQRLSELYPSYFKSPPKFGDALAGGSSQLKMPLTAAEQAYNAQVQRGMELGNRQRDMMNGLIYRASQLGDQKALETLKQLHGGHGEPRYGLNREETNPLYRYNVNGEKIGPDDKADMLDQRQEEVRQALFDQTPDLTPEMKVSNARRKALAYQNALLAQGKKSPYEDVNDMIAAMTGTTWNGKYFVQQ